MYRVYIETYGCTANKSDSEIMIGVLKRAGYLMSDLNEADYLVVNTCGVKQATENKIIDRLKKLSGLNKKLIIAGCLTKINMNRIKKEVPNFSALVDPKSVHEIANIVDRVRNSSEQIIQFSEIPEEKPSLPRFSFSDVIDIIRLSEGCLSSCSFCATKLARGDLHSYRPEIIRNAVEQGLKNDHKEFHLTSEDSSAYGRDIRTNLPELLESVAKINGEFFIRVGMMNPLHFKKVEIRNLIKVYKHERIFKFLHLCVQSGSNKVLCDMRRGYSVEEFIDYVKHFREEIPELTLSTDIIVGFPSETDSDFERTVDLLKKIKPDVVNLSKYSVRPGTLSAKMKKLDSKIVDKRSNEIHKLIRKISRKNNEKWIGWKGKVLIDENGKGETMISRNYSYKPVVTSVSIGSFKDVKIVEAEDMHLVGE